MLFDLCQFGTINQLDFEQSAFKASRRLPLALAAGTNIGIAPEVANSKADQGPLFRIIDTDVTLHQCLGIGARDFDVEIAQRRVLGRTDQRGDGTCEERLGTTPARSEEHTSELQSLMRISYAVLCLT